MAQLERSFSKVEIYKVYSFGLDVLVRLVKVKGGNDYECVKHEWSEVQVI
jgi:hypothetical protein